MKRFWKSVCEGIGTMHFMMPIMAGCMAYVAFCEGCASHHLKDRTMGAMGSAARENVHERICVIIEGYVFHPGEYVLEEGATLGDLVDMAVVDSMPGDQWALHHVFVSRNIDGIQQRKCYNCSAGREDRHFVLKDGDYVKVQRLVGF